MSTKFIGGGERQELYEVKAIRLLSLEHMLQSENNNQTIYGAQLVSPVDKAAPGPGIVFEGDGATEFILKPLIAFQLPPVPLRSFHGLFSF